MSCRFPNEERTVSTMHGAVLHANQGIRLDLSWVDYLMIAVYFLVVIGIGFIARTRVKSSMDLFLSRRSLPAAVKGAAA